MLPFKTMITSFFTLEPLIVFRNPRPCPIGLPIYTKILDSKWPCHKKIRIKYDPACYLLVTSTICSTDYSFSRISSVYRGQLMQTLGMAQGRSIEWIAHRNRLFKHVSRQEVRFWVAYSKSIKLISLSPHWMHICWTCATPLWDLNARCSYRASNWRGRQQDQQQQFMDISSFNRYRNKLGIDYYFLS